MTLVKITEVTPGNQFSLDGEPVKLTNDYELVRFTGFNEKGQRQYLIDTNDLIFDVPQEENFLVSDLAPVVPPRQHFGIIRANYTSVEWVMKNGGGWSLSSKPSDRANFVSLDHATEVLENICRLYHWGNECLTVVPLAKHSVTGQLPSPSPSSIYEEGTTFVVLRESETHQDGFSVCTTEYVKDLYDRPDGFDLDIDKRGEFTTDIDERWEFDTLGEAREAVEYLEDKYLVVVPIAPKPLSPAAIASSEKLASELLKSDKPNPDDRPCQCGSGEPWVICTVESTYCG